MLLQDVLKAADQAGSTGQDPGEALRLAALQQVWQETGTSATTHLVDTHGGSPTQHQAARPPWRSVRSKSPLTHECAAEGSGSGRSSPSASGYRGAAAAAAEDRGGGHVGVAGKRSGCGSSKGKVQQEGCSLDVDAAWEAQLPAGMTADKCAGLPLTTSVRELVEVRFRQQREWVTEGALGNTSRLVLKPVSDSPCCMSK